MIKQTPENIPGDHYRRPQPRDTFPQFWGKCPTGPLPFPMKARLQMKAFSPHDIKGVHDFYVPCFLVAKDFNGNKTIEFSNEESVPENLRGKLMVLHQTQKLEVFF